MSKFLCMEVGTNIVRLAEVMKTGNRVEILDTYAFDTPEDATVNGKVRSNSPEIVAAIRDGIDKSGMKSTDVYFIVESHKILYQNIEVQAIKSKDIMSMLTNNFSEYFPAKEETLHHIAYVQKKPVDKNGQKMLSLDVFAIPNDLSESYYNLAVSLGLNAKGLSDSSHSMVSLLGSRFKHRNVAMVNINENTSSISIIANGNMLYNKTIEKGVADAILAVQNTTLTNDGITCTEACEQLYTNNIVLKETPHGVITNETSEEDKLRYKVTTSINALINVVDHELTAYLSKNNLSITGISLSGLGAGFSGISQLFTYTLNVPTDVVQEDGNLKINPHAASDTLLLGTYPCVGAAVDATNFFNAEEQRGGLIAHNRQIDKYFLFGGTLTALVSFTVGAYKLMNAKIDYDKAFDTNTTLNRKVEELRENGVEEAYNRYNTAISYEKEVNNLYNETKSGNEDMHDFLNELEEVLPKEARVLSLNISPSSAEISVTCKDRFVAAGVLHKLRNMETIHSMDCVGVAEMITTGEVAFNCSFVLKSSIERQPIILDENGNPVLDENGNPIIDESQLPNGGDESETTPDETTAPEESTPEESTPDTTEDATQPSDETQPTDETTTPDETENTENGGEE